MKIVGFYHERRDVKDDRSAAQIHANGALLLVVLHISGATKRSLVFIFVSCSFLLTSSTLGLIISCFNFNWVSMKNLKWEDTFAAKMFRREKQTLGWNMIQLINLLRVLNIIFFIFFISNHNLQKRNFEKFLLFNMISNLYSYKNVIPGNKSRRFPFFSHVLLQITAICSSLRANSHEKASWSCSKIRRDRPYSLIALLALDWENSSDFPCRCGLVNTTNDSRGQWDRLYYFAKRVAPCAPRYIILHSFLILLMLHPWCLLVPSRINSRSFRPRFNDRLDWERGGSLRKTASKQRSSRANFNLLINFSILAHKIRFYKFRDFYSDGNDPVSPSFSRRAKRINAMQNEETKDLDWIFLLKIRIWCFRCSYFHIYCNVCEYNYI